MTAVKSLEDLEKVRREALERSQRAIAAKQTIITLGTTTPAIAAGGRETLKAIESFIETHQLENIVVRQTGNLGMDSWQPIVQVKIGDQPKVTYIRVDQAAARRIMQEHVLDGRIVQEYLNDPSSII